jgi:hypothetical protein
MGQAMRDGVSLLHGSTIQILGRRSTGVEASFDSGTGA